MKARTPLHEPPGQLLRIVLAASISIALHVAVLALPAPRGTPLQPQLPEPMAALPVEMAGDASVASTPLSAAGPPHLGAREETVALSAPSAVADLPRNSEVNESGARLYGENVAPEGPGSPGRAILAAAPLPGAGSSSPSSPGTGTEPSPASDGQGSSAASPGPASPAATSPGVGNPGGGGSAPGGTGGTEGTGGTSNVSTSGGGTLIHARVMSGPKPVYPERARRRGEEGTVRLKVQVLPTGSVGEVEVVSSAGYPDLEKAAVDCVKGQWKFAPATLDGRPAEDWVERTFNFRLE